MKTIEKFIAFHSRHGRFAIYAVASLIIAGIATPLLVPVVRTEISKRQLSARYEAMGKQAEISILSTDKSPASWPDSMRAEQFFRRHVHYGELSINEMKIGGAYSDLYQDSMRMMRDSVLSIRLLADSKRNLPRLSKIRYVARFLTPELTEPDTFTAAINMDGQVIFITGAAY